MRDFNRQLAVATASLVTALGSSACAANRSYVRGKTGNATHLPSPNIANRTAVITEGSIQTIYYKDGSREIVLHQNPELANQAFYAGDILQFCVNGLLYSQTEGLDEPGVNKTKDGTFSGTPSTQIIDAPWAIAACRNGQLTPNDFNYK